MTRRCALATCGITFTARPRQLYCVPEHSMAARDLRRDYGHCAHCRKPIPLEQHRRFCNSTCQSTYALERRGRRGKRVIEPVAVLLPAGCNPSPLRLSALPTAYGEIARKVFCRRMERCLSYAVSKRWGGLSCQKCDVDEPEIPALRPKGSNWSW